MGPFAAVAVGASDPSGERGLALDLRTFQALGVAGRPVVAAVGAGDAEGAGPAYQLPAATVAAQLQRALRGLRNPAVKASILETVPLLRLVGRLLREAGSDVVVDSGPECGPGLAGLRSAAAATALAEFLPVAALVLVRPEEAQRLCGLPVRTEAEAKAAARRIQALGPRAVLVRWEPSPPGTGEAAGLLDGHTWRCLAHGTPGGGPAAPFSLGAAVTAWVARGETLPDAVDRAFRFLCEEAGRKGT